jgi:hypothetical protein
MTWTLTSGETVFEISNGRTRSVRVADRIRLSLQQQTDVVTRTRAAWPTAFPDRAASTLSFAIPVTFPPCASLQAAMLEAHQVPTQCPRGGVLTCEDESTLITYSQAWRTSIEVTPLGVTNQFTFNFQAINPDFTRSTLGLLNMNYVANLYLITGLTGGGSSKLDGYTTTDVTVGFTAFLPALLISSIAVPKMMQLVTGTDAENADPSAGMIIIRPDDFHASTNPKVWKEKL